MTRKWSVSIFILKLLHDAPQITETMSLIFEFWNVSNKLRFVSSNLTFLVHLKVTKTCSNFFGDKIQKNHNVKSVLSYFFWRLRTESVLRCSRSRFFDFVFESRLKIEKRRGFFPKIKIFQKHKCLFDANTCTKIFFIQNMS